MSSTNRGGIKINQDRYYTPRWCIELLVERIDFSRVTSFLEPCAGDGRILDYIPSPIIKWSCEIDKGINYFDYRTNYRDDLIITNPPFSQALKFLEKSLNEAKTVCYLQRLNWLGSKTRKDFWNSNMPDKLFVLSQRPQFMKELGIKSGTDSTEYAWFIWDKPGIVNGKHLEIL